MTPRLRSGRPTAQLSSELDQHIISVAERLFIRQGYAATSMEQVAAESRSGKQTIYRRHASKEALFKAVVQALSARLLDAIKMASTTNEDPLDGLRDACRATLDYVCSPEVISILRIMIAEAERFPGLAAAARRISRERHEAFYRPLIRAAQERSQIRADAPAEALGHVLSGLMIGWVSHYSFLGEPRLTGGEERKAFFDAAWAVFLRGAAVNGGLETQPGPPHA